MATPQQLLSIVLDKGSQPGERANALDIFYRRSGFDRDTLVKKLLEKSKARSTSKKLKADLEQELEEMHEKYEKLEEKYEELEEKYEESAKRIEELKNKNKDEKPVNENAKLKVFWVIGILVATIIGPIIGYYLGLTAGIPLCLFLYLRLNQIESFLAKRKAP